MNWHKLAVFAGWLSLVPASIWAVTVAIPGGGGGVVASVANTWTALQTFGDLNATDQVGLGAAWATGDADVEVEATMRVSGSSGGPSGGAGLEMAYIAPDTFIVAYSRVGATYIPLTINGAPTYINPNTAYVDIGGQTKLRQYTSTDMRVAAPQAAGYYATNITAFKLCIASGTGAGAWVDPTDGTTACD